MSLQHKAALFPRQGSALQPLLFRQVRAWGWWKGRPRVRADPPFSSLGVSRGAGEGGPGCVVSAIT